MAGIRITLKETGQQSIARLWVYNPNEEKEPDYLIHFGRPKFYDGYFGFDYMRQEYKNILFDNKAIALYQLSKTAQSNHNDRVRTSYIRYLLQW